jgi:hypothetical protein
VGRYNSRTFCMCTLNIIQATGVRIGGFLIDLLSPNPQARISKNIYFDDGCASRISLVNVISIGSGDNR